MRRERDCVAEGASNDCYESLRQKDSCMTHLWRVSALTDHQRGKPQGQTFRYMDRGSPIRGISVFFHEN
jgi:hypothetical protein